MTSLELHLLRRSVGTQERHRHRCRHCHRTPLTGEHIFFYAEELVCELCRPLHRQVPERTELMHSSEHDRAVRLLRAA